MRVAGLAPVNGVQDLENIDVTSLVNGHMAYRAAMPKLLRKVGWEVESDEFTEIEDPDPDNHEKRQRELIRELDEARKEAEAKPEKKRFGFFKKGKLAQKKGWETYDDSMGKEDWSTKAVDGEGNVLFDIEAIKAELLSEQIEVTQLESTLPPMKLNLDGASAKGQSGFGIQPEAVSSAPISKDNKDNPFDKGYDEYNLSAENISYPLSAEHTKLSFESPPTPSLPEESRSARESPQIPGLNGSTEPRLSAQTSPTLDSTLTTHHSDDDNPSLEHNAWADEDDPEFGKEQEVKLTF